VTLAVLAYDYGPGTGMGHRRRMEALASALAHSGMGVECRRADGPLEGDVVVVDSYRRRADDADVDARFVAAVDDLCRDLGVHLVVDPTPGADVAVHRRARRVLAGAPFALVTGGKVGRAVTAPPQHVLVTTGAADERGTGHDVALDLATLGRGLAIRLVTGPWGCIDVPTGVEGVQAMDGLDEQLEWADIVVTAGGVTMLEAMRAGRAVVALVTADNQRRAVDGAAAAGAVIRSDVDTAAADVARLLDDSSAVHRLGAAATDLIDGRGAERVASALIEMIDR
jgi:spore coat polysaccharide biosynthesis predicted glycosyltransferase SpsG